MEKLLKKSVFLLMALGLSANAFALHVYGYVEKVRLGPEKAIVKAKLDTGAVSASLYALNVTVFKKDNEDWVSFDVPLENKLLHLTKKLRYFVNIKPRHSEIKKYNTNKPLRRPVVGINLTLGSQTSDIDVNLANRKDFNYPLLLGRKALILFDVAVNPAHAFIAKLAPPAKEH